MSDLAQSEINARMRRWDDAEIDRAIKRIGLFGRRGLGPGEAEQLADRLALRDQEEDDRRMCIECSNWQQSRTCFKRLPTSFEQLVRCAGFQWQKP